MTGTPPAPGTESVPPPTSPPTVPPAAGKRPGGLTALAVLNFVFGGLGILFSIIAMAGVAALKHIAKSAADEVGAQINLPTGVIYLLLLLALAMGALLIVAGVGYLQQKRVMGKLLGTVYGVGAIVINVINLATGAQTFGVGLAIGLIYPVLTLILLNTTFKNDFPN